MARITYLTAYYSSLAHGLSAGANEVVSLQDVLEQEQNYPNATVDAKRFLATINSLTCDLSSRKLLDVGCGYGFFSNEALGQGFEVTAIEVSPREIKIAHQMTGIEPTRCSFEDFQSQPRTFHAVLMSQTLEHAFDVDLWVKKAYDFLAVNGVIAVAVPNFMSIFRVFMQEKDPFICPPEHLNFFSAKGLSRLLERHGFSVEEVQCISRLPISSFEKRLPKYFRSIIPLVRACSSAGLSAFDAHGAGMFVNVYARKI